MIYTFTQCLRCYSNRALPSYYIVLCPLFIICYCFCACYHQGYCLLNLYLLNLDLPIKLFTLNNNNNNKKSISISFNSFCKIQSITLEFNSVTNKFKQNKIKKNHIKVCTPQLEITQLVLLLEKQIFYLWLDRHFWFILTYFPAFTSQTRKRKFSKIFSLCSKKNLENIMLLAEIEFWLYFFLFLFVFTWSGTSLWTYDKNNIRNTQMS